MSRRTVATVVAVLALVGVASGCSLREVQLWFAINRKQNISRDQARSLADLVNSKRAPGGCDGNYAGPCVPDNATQVHCAGTSGPGPEVRGPLTVKGWDSFELDPDGDKNACVDPVGSVDLIGQVLDGVSVGGWAFDPNTTDPISVDIYDNDVGTRIAASGSRPDIGAAFPGAGNEHGFGTFIQGDLVGEKHKVCAVAINEGPGSHNLLQCKTITLFGIDGFTSPGGNVIGLIEGADRRGDGSVRVRGFVASNTAASYFLGSDQGEYGPTLDSGLFDRPDVDTAASVPAGTNRGFDVVIPAGHAMLGTSAVCLVATVSAGTAAVMCRPYDT